MLNALDEKSEFCSDAGFQGKSEGEGCLRQRANTQTSAAIRLRLSPSLLLSSPAEVMFFLWAERLSNANSVTRLQRCSLPSRPSGKNMRRLHLGAASLWLRLTNTHTHHFLFQCTLLCQTHTLYLCNAHKTHSATLLHYFPALFLPHTHTGTRAHTFWV